MKRWQIEMIRWSTYLLEVSSLYIFILPLFLLSGRYPPPPLYLMTVIFGAIIFTFIHKKTNAYPAILLSFPLLSAFCLLIGWHWFFAIVLSLILSWRLFTLANDGHPRFGLLLSFITLLFGVVIYSSNQDMDHIYHVLFIVILHFIWTSFIQIASMISLSDGHEKGKEILKVFLLHAFITVLIINSKLIFPFIEMVLRSIGKIIALLIGMPATPLLKLFPSLSGQSGPIEDREGINKPAEHVGIENAQPIPLDPNLFLILLISILVLIILFFLLRKKDQLPVNMDESNAVSIKIEETTTNTRRKNRIAPQNPVRRYLLSLEKSLAKNGYGRRSDQTVEDWLSTLQTDDTAKAIVIQNYQKVRYGEMELTKEDISAYKKAIALLKKTVK